MHASSNSFLLYTLKLNVNRLLELMFLFLPTAECEEARILTSVINCTAICYLELRRGLYASPLVSTHSSPRRKPWPQLWRPAPPACSWAAGLLLGGTPKPDTPPLLLGKRRYLERNAQGCEIEMRSFKKLMTNNTVIL